MNEMVKSDRDKTMMLRPITKITTVIEAFRNIEPEMKAQHMHTLLVIADNPWIQFAEIESHTKMSRSAVARNIAWLSVEFGRGLITMKEDPADRRNKIAKLARKGELFIAQLEKIVAG